MTGRRAGKERGVPGQLCSSPRQKAGGLHTYARYFFSTGIQISQV